MADTQQPTLEPGLDAHRSLERSAVVGVAWKFVGQIGVQATRLVTVAVLAHLLSPTDYGQAAIAVTLAAFAPTLGDMGMGAALVQTERHTQTVRATTFWASVGFGVAMTVVFVVAVVPVGLFLDDSEIASIVAAGALTFAIYAVGAPSQATRMRAMNFRGIELRYLLALAAAGTLSIAAAAGGAGPWALVLQQLVLGTLFVAALWVRAGWHPTPEFSRPVFRELRSFALRVAGGRWARLAELLVLSLLIGKLVSVTDLGVWAFAMSTVIVPLSVICIPIAEVLFSAFSRMQTERERISALWLTSLGVLAAVVMPLLAGLVVVAPDAIPLVFGSQWSTAVPVVQILCVYVLIRSLQSWNSVILDAVGRPHITMWTQAAALCLAPVVVLLGSRWGIEAVAAFFVLGQLVAVEIPSFVFVCGELRLRPRQIAARLSGVVLATLLMAVVCLAARQVLELSGVGIGARALGTIVTGIVIYPALLSVLAPDLRSSVMRLLGRRFRRTPVAGAA